MLETPRPSLEDQLFSNQLWETVAFIAKAAFMLGLTPWMIRVWGAEGYGEFALASSAFVLLSLVDFGVRARTRLSLCAERDRAQWVSILWHSASTFTVIGASTIILSMLFTAFGVFSALFKISEVNRNLLLLTTVMSMLVMLSGLLLEPLIAAGRIGQTKCVTAVGWLCSIPCVAAVLVLKGGAIEASAVWLGCLFAANLSALLFNFDLFRGRIASHGDFIGVNKFISILKDAFWINICNATWMTKTYGITLIIAALNGPTAAGLFFIFFRLSEVITGVGAISCDVLLVELAQRSTAEERRHSFLSSYSWALVLCSHTGLLIAFFARDFFNFWLPSAAPISIFVGIVIVLLGFASAFNRTATYAAIGLGLAKTAAAWGFVEAISFVAAILLGSIAFGLLGQLGFALIATLALVPIARSISETLEASHRRVWFDPWRDVVPFVAASVGILSAGGLISMPVAKLLSIPTCLGIGIANLSRWLRKRERRPSPELPGRAIIAVESPC